MDITAFVPHYFYGFERQCPKRRDYFIAEIKSLKRIFSMVNSNITCLCIIDEVLRGTNTVERIAASSRLLYHLAQENTCIFAATHDVELTHILDKVYENKHFEEEITDDDINSITR